MQRFAGRAYNQLRPVKISYDMFGYAQSSILFELGNTKILCSVTLQPGVPPFLKGSKQGWLTAEYAMLPTSSQQRIARESTTAKRNDRAIEISRLIGRCLRSIVDLGSLGERTIMVDCDVLQADGSTRTAAITGAGLALKIAINAWRSQGIISQDILMDELVAVSAGSLQGTVLLDLDYSEDSIIDADYNFVITKAGKIVEIQGCSEKQALSWESFDAMKNVVLDGVKQLFKIIDASLLAQSAPASLPVEKTRNHTPLFSLKNRIQSAE